MLRVDLERTNSGSIIDGGVLKSLYAATMFVIEKQKLNVDLNLVA